MRRRAPHHAPRTTDTFRCASRLSQTLCGGGATPPPSQPLHTALSPGSAPPSWGVLNRLPPLQSRSFLHAQILSCSRHFLCLLLSVSFCIQRPFSDPLTPAFPSSIELGVGSTEKTQLLSTGHTQTASPRGLCRTPMTGQSVQVTQRHGAWVWLRQPSPSTVTHYQDSTWGRPLLAAQCRPGVQPPARLPHLHLHAYPAEAARQKLRSPVPPPYLGPLPTCSRPFNLVASGII